MFVGSIATITCNNGYKKDPSGAADPVCDGDTHSDNHGTWKPAPPKCVGG